MWIVKKLVGDSHAGDAKGTLNGALVYGVFGLQLADFAEKLASTMGVLILQ